MSVKLRIRRSISEQRKKSETVPFTQHWHNLVNHVSSVRCQTTKAWSIRADKLEPKGCSSGSTAYKYTVKCNNFWDFGHCNQI